MKQKILGQYFTSKNIFKNKIFLDWFNSIPKDDKEIILEPFAGKNGLIDMLNEIKLIINYSSYDIEPQAENVLHNDSLTNFPTGFSTCITNPPFLAKNIATRKNIPVLVEPFADLYEKCLDLCLKNCQYVAAIVPESFIVSPFFKNRLFAVISLSQKSLFDHTEHPVCLALFNPGITDDFFVYLDEVLIGKYHEKLNFINNWLGNFSYPNIIFHQPEGQLGLFNIDATDTSRKIHFDNGELIDPKDVGYHARLRTRISILTPKNKPLTKKQLNKFINLSNQTLNEYRTLTQDMFLTSFKGLRSDGKYRRRLDYATARIIVAKTYQIFFQLD